MRIIFEVNRKGLLSFLHTRIKDGYCFPLSPMWMLCDAEFYEVKHGLSRESARHNNVQIDSCFLLLMIRILSF